MDAYRLELARGSDAAHLAAMSRQFVETGLAPAWDAARILWHIRHPDSLVLCARAEELAGFAIMRYADDSAHLNLLAVEPAHRRRGVARRLMAWLEATALTAGTFRIALELRAGNEAARAFYSALGYSDLTLVPGYYQGREAALRMVRNIAVASPDAAPPA